MRLFKYLSDMSQMKMYTETSLISDNDHTNSVLLFDISIVK